MNQFRWRSVVAGFLILTFPLMRAGTARAMVDSLAGADREDSGSSPAVLNEEDRTLRELWYFLEANASHLKTAEVDEAIWRLLALENEYLKSYEAELFSGSTNLKLNRYTLAELIGLREFQEEYSKDLVRNIPAEGFILSRAEGMVEAAIDFPGISARFGRYASQPVAGYLRIMARETGRHFAEDAALKISPDTLGRRIVAIETFLKENRRFPRQNELNQMARKYLSAYFLGLNNTPAFSYRTNRLNGTFLQSYRDSRANYPGTRLAAFIENYLRILSENGFQKTEPVLDFANKAIVNF